MSDSAPKSSAPDATTSQKSVEEEGNSSSSTDLLDRLDAHLPQSSERGTQASRVLVGLVVDDRHPVLIGRVRVRWTDGSGETREQWLPALHAMAVRTQDRVLVQHAENWDEPIVTGVIDGFAKRPETAKIAAAALEMKSDEVVRIDSSEGKPLLEIHSSENGPVLKLLNEDVELEVPGKFRVSAKSIALEAKQGNVTLTAHDDAVVVAEHIKLN